MQTDPKVGLPLIRARLLQRLVDAGIPPEFRGIVWMRSLIQTESSIPMLYLLQDTGAQCNSSSSSSGNGSEAMTGEKEETQTEQHMSSNKKDTTPSTTRTIRCSPHPTSHAVLYPSSSPSDIPAAAAPPSAKKPNRYSTAPDFSAYLPGILSFPLPDTLDAKECPCVCGQTLERLQREREQLESNEEKEEESDVTTTTTTNTTSSTPSCPWCIRPYYITYYDQLLLTNTAHLGKEGLPSHLSSLVWWSRPKDDDGHPVPLTTGTDFQQSLPPRSFYLPPWQSDFMQGRVHAADRSTPTEPCPQGYPRFLTHLHAPVTPAGLYTPATSVLVKQVRSDLRRTIPHLWPIESRRTPRYVGSASPASQEEEAVAKSTSTTTSSPPVPLYMYGPRTLPIRYKQREMLLQKANGAENDQHVTDTSLLPPLSIFSPSEDQFHWLHTENYACASANAPVSTLTTPHASTQDSSPRDSPRDSTPTYTTPPSTTASPRLYLRPASLFRLLLAIGSHATAIGYCQGLNFIAAHALRWLSEPDAFACLVHIISELLPPHTFSDLSSVTADQEVLGETLQGSFPLLLRRVEFLAQGQSLTELLAAEGYKLPAAPKMTLFSRKASKENNVGGVTGGGGMGGGLPYSPQLYATAQARSARSAKNKKNQQAPRLPHYAVPTPLQMSGPVLDTSNARQVVAAVTLKWLMCLYTVPFYYTVTERVWDRLFFGGPWYRGGNTVLFTFALALLRLAAPSVMSSNDFGTAMHQMDHIASRAGGQRVFQALWDAWYRETTPYANTSTIPASTSGSGNSGSGSGSGPPPSPYQGPPHSPAMLQHPVQGSPPLRAFGKKRSFLSPYGSAGGTSTPVSGGDTPTATPVITAGTGSPLLALPTPPDTAPLQLVATPGAHDRPVSEPPATTPATAPWTRKAGGGGGGGAVAWDLLDANGWAVAPLPGVYYVPGTDQRVRSSQTALSRVLYGPVQGSTGGTTPYLGEFRVGYDRVNSPPPHFPYNPDTDFGYGVDDVVLQWLLETPTVEGTDGTQQRTRDESNASSISAANTSNTLGSPALPSINSPDSLQSPEPAKTQSNATATTPAATVYGKTVFATDTLDLHNDSEEVPLLSSLLHDLLHTETNHNSIAASNPGAQHNAYPVSLRRFPSHLIPVPPGLVKREETQIAPQLVFSRRKFHLQKCSSSSSSSSNHGASSSATKTNPSLDTTAATSDYDDVPPPVRPAVLDQWSGEALPLPDSPPGSGGPGSLHNSPRSNSPSLGAAATHTRTSGGGARSSAANLPPPKKQHVDITHYHHDPCFPAEPESFGACHRLWALWYDDPLQPRRIPLTLQEGYWPLPVQPPRNSIASVVTGAGDVRKPLLVAHLNPETQVVQSELMQFITSPSVLTLENPTSRSTVSREEEDEVFVQVEVQNTAHLTDDRRMSSPIESVDLDQFQEPQFVGKSELGAPKQPTASDEAHGTVVELILDDSSEGNLLIDSHLSQEYSTKTSLSPLPKQENDILAKE